MAEGENRSDMFSQQRVQQLCRRRERDLSNRQQQNDSSEKSDYVEGERMKGAIDNNRMTSSEKSDYVEGERGT